MNRDYIVIQSSNILLGCYVKEERNKRESMSKEEDILGAFTYMPKLWERVKMWLERSLKTAHHDKIDQISI